MELAVQGSLHLTPGSLGGRSKFRGKKKVTPRTLTPLPRHSERAPYKKKPSRAKEQQDGCPPWLPASPEQRAATGPPRPVPCVPAHCCNCSGHDFGVCGWRKSRHCCCTVPTEFSQLPGWLPKTMRLNFPPLSFSPPQDLPICCTASCPGKAMLASIPLPKILQCLFWFLQIVLALTPHTVTTDSQSRWSPLSDSKVCIIFASLQPYTSTFCLIILSNLLMWLL